MIACSTGTLLIQSKLPDNLECMVLEAFVIPILPCHTVILFIYNSLSKMTVKSNAIYILTRVR
jgi:hypothetical protein